MKFEAKLISFDGFKVIRTFEFDDREYPATVYENRGDAVSLFECGISEIQTNYLWVTQKMFSDCLIIDKQNGYTIKRGFPDFIALRKVRGSIELKYVEFKGVSDNLSPHQIKWFADNCDKERYLITLSQVVGI